MNGMNFLLWRGREDKNEGVACPVGGRRPAVGGFAVLWVGALWENRFSFCGEVGCFYLAVGFLPARLGIVFPLAQRGPQPSRWGQTVSWRLCRLETARTLRVLCRLTDGTYPLRGKSLFCLPGRGQNHFFFCPAKEKVVLDSEKEKGDQWKSWGGAVQQARVPML